MKKQNYELGGLDAIPDGVLLNPKQISQLLGISAATARAIIANEGFKTIRLSSAINSPILIKAGELKLFLDKGGAEPAERTENVETLVDTIAAANAEPNAEKNVTSAEPTDAPAEPTPKGKGKKTPDRALADAGFKRWHKNGGKGIKGYGGRN